MSVCRWEPGDLDGFEVKDLDEVVKQVERAIPNESPLFKYFVVDAVLSSQFQIPLDSILRVWDVHVQAAAKFQAEIWNSDPNSHWASVPQVFKEAA